MHGDSLPDRSLLDKIARDPAALAEIIYTPIDEAVQILRKRWEDHDLEQKVEKYFQGDIPPALKQGFRAVVFRQLVTPNFELEHFIKILNKLNLKPFFLEYFDDKFTSNNPLKHSLGKLRFYQGLGKKSGLKMECTKIIDFNENNGKKIKDVKTLWGQSLVDFHHELLNSAFPNMSEFLFDASNWFHRAGKDAKEYYSKYLALFLRHGILFENFVLTGGELKFVKETFLPAFINVWEMMGVKPIISPLLPVGSEDDVLWVSHRDERRQQIVEKLSTL